MMEEYQRLKCECGSDEFVEKCYLKWKKGSGLVKEPCGQKCARCNRNVLSSSMIKEVEIHELDRQIQQLQEEKANAAPARNEVQAQKGKQPETRVSGQQQGD